MVNALRRSIRRRLMQSFVGICLLALSLAPEGNAQDVFRRVLAVSPTAYDTSGDTEFAGGASLRTAPELEQFLKRAELFAEEERYDLASVLWQRVLDESSGMVMTRDDKWTQKTSRRTYRRYRAFTGEVEQTIAKLPSVGLRVYRLTADGEAQALLASGKGGDLEEALSQVTSRYFLSSHGDDAAYRLGCLRMDRYDFVGASRLFAKVLDEYPDSNIRQDELLLRLSVASARVGDREAAKLAWDRIDRDGTDLSVRLLSLVEAELSREVNDGPRLAEASHQWPMAFGNPSRTGHMKSLPGSMTEATMSELWTATFNTSVSVAKSSEYPYQVYEEFDLLKQDKTTATSGGIVGRWKKQGWTPVGGMLFGEGLVYHKTSDRVVCRDAKTGELVWMGRKNRFQPDQLSAFYMRHGQSSGRPANAAETMLFGDRIHQGMAIADGWLFNIEGSVIDDFKRSSAQAKPVRSPHFGYGGSVTRARRNFMSAYNARNGKLKWHRSAGNETQEVGKFDIGFLAAPVPFARFLLVPVIDGVSLWVYAIEKKTGKTAWKSFLCDDPESGASPWSPVALAVDGGDAYISTGGGVVFAIDALSGATRWCVRYERSGVSPRGNANRYGTYQVFGRSKGWLEDMLIPHGKHLVVMASDSNDLFALDRRTGEFLWESPRTPYSNVPPGEYCLGVVGEGLYVGGRNIVRRYDIPSGRLRWEAKLQDSLGRGALTEDAVYMPENSTVVRLDLKGGKRLAQVGVFSASDEPVGNLFTDGRRLISLGAGRVYALTDLSHRLGLLARRINDGDVQSQLERMRLRLRDKNHDGALEDLRGAYDLLMKNRQVEGAAVTMFTGIDELAITSRDPQLALTMVAEVPVSDTALNKAFADEILSKRDEVVLSALRRITENSLQGAAQQVLDVVPLCREERLLRAARTAMKTTATSGNQETLEAALASPRVGVRTVAMAGLPGAFGDDASEMLLGLLNDDSDHIKLEAAWTLANTGNRQSLIPLGELLDSEDLKVRVRSSQTLRAITGQKIQFSAYDDPSVRTKQAKAWREWIIADGQTAKLDFPIREGALLMGRTLICYYSQNKVVELDSQGEETWTAKVPYAWGCQGLPNGHRLVASYSGRFIAEFDDKGREIWKKTGLPGAPFSVQRLDNGNTLVTCSDSQKVVEIAPDKSIAWEIEISGRPMDAKRLDNGNTLIALQSLSKVVEVDRSGEVVWEVAGQGGVLAASRLDNGNTLVCRQANTMVAELNRQGEVVWSRGGLRNPCDAQRLPDGNTLVVDFEGVKEINPKGEVVWQRAGNGASRVHRY